MGSAKLPFSNILPAIFCPLTLAASNDGRSSLISSARSSNSPLAISTTPSAVTLSAAEATLPSISARRSAKVAARSIIVLGAKASLIMPFASTNEGCTLPFAVNRPARAVSATSASASAPASAFNTPSQRSQLPLPSSDIANAVALPAIPAINPSTGAVTCNATSKRLASGTASSFSTSRSPSIVPPVAVTIARRSAIFILPSKLATCRRPATASAKTIRSIFNRSISISRSGSKGSPVSGTTLNNGLRDTVISGAVRASIST